MSTPVELSPQSIEAIAQRFVEILRGSPRTEDILTLAEAKAYAKRNSDRAFYAWCKRWGVKPREHGRYSRAKLDLALEREAGTAHLPAAMRREQKALSQSGKVAA